MSLTQVTKGIFFPSLQVLWSSREEVEKQQFRSGYNSVIIPLASLGAEDGLEEDRLLSLLAFLFALPRRGAESWCSQRRSPSSRKSTAWADRMHTFLIWCLAFVRTKNKENCICRNLRPIINPDFLIPTENLQQREAKSRHLKGESILPCTEREQSLSFQQKALVSGV